MLSFPHSNAKWLWRRLRLRCSPRPGPRLGLVFGDFANVGDQSLGRALVQALPGCHLEPYLYPGNEKWLGRLGLSGTPMLDAVILGGGTFINGMGLGIIKTAVGQGLPVWIFGTGAGRGSYAEFEDSDLGPWSALLPKCQGVGVRGPRTMAHLAAIGFTGATLIGDLALGHTLQRLPPAGNPRCIAVNAVMPDRNRRATNWGFPDLAGYLATLRRLRATGFKFRPFAMTPEDVEATQQLLAAAGVLDADVFAPARDTELQPYLSECGLVLSMRLHGAVLATAFGIPAVQIGYMAKALDFALSLGLERQHVPVQAASDAAVWAAVRHTQLLGEAGRQQTWRKALELRCRIEAFGATVVERHVARLAVTSLAPSSTTVPVTGF